MNDLTVLKLVLNTASDGHFDNKFPHRSETTLSHRRTATNHGSNHYPALNETHASSPRHRSIVVSTLPIDNEVRPPRSVFKRDVICSDVSTDEFVDTLRFHVRDVDSSFGISIRSGIVPVQYTVHDRIREPMERQTDPSGVKVKVTDGIEIGDRSTSVPHPSHFRSIRCSVSVPSPSSTTTSSTRFRATWRHSSSRRS